MYNVTDRSSNPIASLARHRSPSLLPIAGSATAAPLTHRAHVLVPFLWWSFDHSIHLDDTSIRDGSYLWQNVYLLREIIFATVTNVDVVAVFLPVYETACMLSQLDVQDDENSHLTSRSSRMTLLAVDFTKSFTSNDEIVLSNLSDWGLFSLPIQFSDPLLKEEGLLAFGYVSPFRNFLKKATAHSVHTSEFDECIDDVGEDGSGDRDEMESLDVDEAGCTAQLLSPEPALPSLPTLSITIPAGRAGHESLLSPQLTSEVSPVPAPLSIMPLVLTYKVCLCNTIIYVLSYFFYPMSVCFPQSMLTVLSVWSKSCWVIRIGCVVNTNVVSEPEQNKSSKAPQCMVLACLFCLFLSSITLKSVLFFFYSS